MPDDPISGEVLARARAAWTKLMRRPVTWTGTGRGPTP